MTPKLNRTRKSGFGAGSVQLPSQGQVGAAPKAARPMPSAAVRSQGIRPDSTPRPVQSAKPAPAPKPAPEPKPKPPLTIEEQIEAATVALAKQIGGPVRVQVISIDDLLAIADSQAVPSALPGNTDREKTGGST